MGRAPNGRGRLGNTGMGGFGRLLGRGGAGDLRYELGHTGPGNHGLVFILGRAMSRQTSEKSWSDKSRPRNIASDSTWRSSVTVIAFGSRAILRFAPSVSLFSKQSLSSVSKMMGFAHFSPPEMTDLGFCASSIE